MNMNRRRGAIALSITLGVLLVGGLVTYNIAWIILYKGRIAAIILGVIFFALLTAGVVLNTVFLVREVRRNERQDSFLNAVTHELKTPIASIRLYLETLQRREVPEAQRQEFYKIMLADSDRLLGTVEQATAKLRELEGIGVDHFSIYLMTHGQEETLAAYGEHIIPGFKDAGLKGVTA